MSAQKLSLNLVATENWSVFDLYSFFHQLNIFYNRLYVLDDQIQSKKVRKLKSVLHGSLSRVDPGDQLQLESIEIHSPAEINLRGVGNIIKELGEAWKGYKYRNKIEEDRLKTELEILKEGRDHKRNMNALEEREKADRIIFERLAQLKRLGFPEEELLIAAKALADPYNQLVEISSAKAIETKDLVEEKTEN